MGSEATACPWDQPGADRMIGSESGSVSGDQSQLLGGVPTHTNGLGAVRYPDVGSGAASQLGGFPFTHHICTGRGTGVLSF